ncbi:mitochondrial carrier protein PET8 [Moesziomyces antarcticus T-34]|uniref:Mitochondrial carrier protein PET8 n=1 Tax=Pseudozyma antarctica (strain T-34) TaxID=1151754 RepID=M9MFG6_PSEA3|nr:mitochondrial carrier protein PET8 [Moesziomyces antarcticus T-34]
MFLPRHTSIHADHRPSLGRMSSSTSMISLQVHESILAAKVRDMSAQFGLGLADESASTPQDADTESAHDTSSSGAVSQASAQRDLIVNGTRGKRSIDHIFVGGRPSRGQPQLSANNARDQRKAPRHSAQRTSLRGYAQARWSRHEGLCDRVLRATNVAKLEWEAKAALLHHAYPLAILLLFRAASLGSTTASQRLAHLYAYGVTRGVSPVVTLVYRDTLRSIAWIFQTLRLCERRLPAQLKAASASATPSLRLSQVWQAPLEATSLLVSALLSSEVGAFDPCQKNAVFLPAVEHLADSQGTSSLRSRSSAPASQSQAPELWTELEDAIQRWTARLDAVERSHASEQDISNGPDEAEEHESLASTMHLLHGHLLLLRAIQLTRAFALEPYADNAAPARHAWAKVAEVQQSGASHRPDLDQILNILSQAQDASGRIYDDQLFRNLTTCAQKGLDEALASEYAQRHSIPRPGDTEAPAAVTSQRTTSRGDALRSKDRLRDLTPEDVETTKKIDAETRPALTMRLSSGYAAAQAVVVSASATAVSKATPPSVASASQTVRQKFGRTVSTSSLAAASAKPSPGWTEPGSPTDSVRSGFSLGVARPRRPSSVVSVTPSLLFPPGSAADDQSPNSLADDGYFSSRGSGRTRSASSTQLSGGPVQRPRVTSMYSAPGLVTSLSSASLVAPSVSTTSQQSLNAVASSNPTNLGVPTRRRTGSNASLGSINSRFGSILPKTSPSISEMPEGIGATSRGEPSKSAAADTLRKLKGRRSHTDLRALQSARNDHSSAPPVPALPGQSQARLSAVALPVSTLQPSKSTVFVSLENLPDVQASGRSKVTESQPTESKASAKDHLARTQARIPHSSIPSVLEEGDMALAAKDTTTTGPAFTSALLAGALSGLTVDLLFFPIDTIKTRLQSAQGFWAAGGFSGVYRGLASTAVGSAPGASVFFTTYESMKPALVRWMPDVFGAEGALGPAGVHMAAASMAEVAACLIRVPTEVIKSRQQTMTYGRGTTTLQAFKKVFQEAGVRGYYRGFGSTVGREIPFTCIQFPLYERLKLEMARSRASKDAASGSGVASEERVHALSDQELVRGLPTWQAGLAGSIAGAIAAGLTTPLDVVKTRIMLHTKRSASAHPGGAAAAAASAAESLPRGVNTDIIPTLLHIGRSEGIKTLFSGFLPRTMWIGLGGAVFLGTFDAGIKTLS